MINSNETEENDKKRTEDEATFLSRNKANWLEPHVLTFMAARGISQ